MNIQIQQHNPNEIPHALALKTRANIKNKIIVMSEKCDIFWIYLSDKRTTKRPSDQFLFLVVKHSHELGCHFGHNNDE